MKKIYILLIISSLLAVFSACDKEDNLLDKSVIKVNRGYFNELDEWIYKNLTIPYNIEVKYKWDDGEVINTFHVIPPKVEKAKEFLEAYLTIWVKTYEAEAIAGGNPDYLQQYMPKLLILVGCPQYNSNGTVTLGLAEGGRKVTIFDIDNFAVVKSGPTSTAEDIKLLKKKSIEKSFHTLHHEFAHIMHQTKFYPDEYKEICKGSYTGNWTDIDAITANTRGFITPYSMLNENEDFVEIVAGILTNTFYTNTSHLLEMPERDENGLLTGNTVSREVSEWDLVLHYWGVVFNEDTEEYELAPKAIEGLDKFKKKLNIIVPYYKNNWNIDLYSLQRRIERAIDDFVGIENS